MELTGFITTGLESLGLNGSEVKPINQGEKVKVQGSEQEEKSNLWGIFDGLGETVGEGANDLLAATFDRYVQKTRGGPETSPDTTGDPTDNPGSAVIPESQRNQPGFLQRYQPGFLQRYQSELIVAGVLLGGFLVLRRR